MSISADRDFYSVIFLLGKPERQYERQIGQKLATVLLVAGGLFLVGECTVLIQNHAKKSRRHSWLMAAELGRLVTVYLLKWSMIRLRRETVRLLSWGEVSLYNFLLERSFHGSNTTSNNCFRMTAHYVPKLQRVELKNKIDSNATDVPRFTPLWKNP